MRSSTRFKRCVAFCTARSYDLTGLASFFKSKAFSTRITRDVLHVTNPIKSADLFFFNHGSFVCWGWDKREEQEWLSQVKNYSFEPLKHIETDLFCFCLGDDTSINVHERFKVDIITLESDSAQIKLALSYGLAQSIKMEAFEDIIQDVIRKNSYLPEDIATRGIISLSRRSIFKRMGDIFIVRSSINLNSEYLETPEFFWRNPNLEFYYAIVKKFLDIPSRVAVLNQKLDLLQELLNILNSQVQHRHSTLLEMIIIILILTEIVISLWHF